jgi:hypothetical protein
MYKKSKQTGVIELDGVVIIQDDRNESWQKLVEFLASGGEIKEVEQLESDKPILLTAEIATLNAETKALLEPTDWAINRELDKSSGYKAMPDDIFNERLSIRQSQWEKEQKIIEKYS